MTQLVSRDSPNKPQTNFEYNKSNLYRLKNNPNFDVVNIHNQLSLLTIECRAYNYKDSDQKVKNENLNPSKVNKRHSLQFWASIVGFNLMNFKPRTNCTECPLNTCDCEWQQLLLQHRLHQYETVHAADLYQ